MRAVSISVDGMRALVRQLDLAVAELGRQQSALAETLASVYLDTWAARCVESEARWIAGHRADLLRRIEAATLAGAPAGGLFAVDASTDPSWAATLGEAVAVTAADGRAAAKQLILALDDRASPDTVRSALIVVKPVTDRARAGCLLTAAEMEFLRAYYDALGSRVLQIPGYLRRSGFEWLGRPVVGAVGVPTGLYTGGGAAGPLPARERAWMLGVVGDGLLTLSDERNPGGGWTSLPTDTRTALVAAMRDRPHLVGGADEVATRRAAGKAAVVGGAAFGALSQLMRASKARGGLALSERLMTSAAAYARSVDRVDRRLRGMVRPEMSIRYRNDPLAFDRADRLVLDRLAGAQSPGLLEAGARNHAASVALLTGDGRRDFVRTLVTHRWSDDGAAAGRVVGWLGVGSLQGDPASEITAAQARRAYYETVQTLTEPGSFESARRGLAENTKLQSALAQATKGNIDLYSKVDSGADSSWLGQRASLAQDDALRMLTLVQAAADGRREIAVASEAYKLELIHAARTGQRLPGDTGPITLAEAGRRAGTLDGFAIAAAENATWTKHVNEAAERNAELQEAYEDRAQAATAVKNLAAGALSGVPVVGWLLAGVASTTGDAIILGQSAPARVAPKGLSGDDRRGSLLPPEAAAERAAYDIAAYAHARGEQVPPEAFMSSLAGGSAEGDSSGRRVVDRAEVADINLVEQMRRWVLGEGGYASYVNAYERRAQREYDVNRGWRGTEAGASQD